MHFQRSEQEIESLKRKLTACTREKLNLQEELSEAYRIKVPYITTALMDGKLGTEGRKDIFDWLSRQLSGLSNFPDARRTATPPDTRVQVCFVCLISDHFLLEEDDHSPDTQMQVYHVCALSLNTSMSPRSVHTEGEEQSCLSLVGPRKIFSELAFFKLVYSRMVVQPGGPTCCSAHFGVVVCPSRRSTMLLGPLWSDARALGRTPMIVLLQSKCWPKGQGPT
ncbi:hypothetical protein CsSME_00041736 [Camellia sinensis var. sinensis]